MHEPTEMAEDPPPPITVLHADLMAGIAGFCDRKTRANLRMAHRFCMEGVDCTVEELKLDIGFYGYDEAEEPCGEGEFTADERKFMVQLEREEAFEAKMRDEEARNELLRKLRYMRELTIIDDLSTFTLTVISMCQHLEELKLYCTHELDSIDPLLYMPRLRSLGLMWQDAFEDEVLPRLTQVTRLELDLSERFDGSPLLLPASIQQLSMSNASHDAHLAGLTQLTQLSQLQLLERLDVQPPLAALTAITSLRCLELQSDQQNWGPDFFVNVDAIADLPSLEVLRINDNIKYTSKTGRLAELTNLTQFDLVTMEEPNPIVFKLKNLTRLELSCASRESFMQLTALTNLATLKITDCNDVHGRDLITMLGALPHLHIFSVFDTPTVLRRHLRPAWRRFPLVSISLDDWYRVDDCAYYSGSESDEYDYEISSEEEDGMDDE